MLCRVVVVVVVGVLRGYMSIGEWRLGLGEGLGRVNELAKGSFSSRK